MSELKCPKCRSSALATIGKGLAYCAVDAKTGAITLSGETFVAPPISRARAIEIHCANCGHEWFPAVLMPTAPRGQDRESSDAQEGYGSSVGRPLGPTP